MGPYCKVTCSFIDLNNLLHSNFLNTHLSFSINTEFACPALDFDRLMKNKLMWILHILTFQIRYLELFMEQMKCIKSFINQLSF